MEQQELIVVHVILGLSTMLTGIIGKLMNPDYPNKMMGYRTKWSFKSKETWEFAQEYAGNLMLWGAIAAVTIEILAAFLLEPMTSVIVAIVALTLNFVVVIGKTEYELRRRFNQDGSPKSTIDKF